MTGTLDGNEALALLAWYREAGVDVALSDAPIDWFALPQAPATATGHPPERAARPASRAPLEPPPERTRPPEAPSRPPPLRAPEAAGAAARADLGEVSSLDALAAAIASFEGCGLKLTAKNTCVHRGAAKARVAIIGEAPGREEDIEGKPFVGPAGRLLDKMLAAIGLDESSVHITNIVYWRPPGNRTPTPLEAEACRPFLERQMELVGPEIIVLMGGAAAKQMLGVTEGIMRVRGSWRAITIGSVRARVMPTLHPAYLLRTPIAKRLAWRDLLSVQAALAPQRDELLTRDTRTPPPRST